MNTDFSYHDNIVGLNDIDVWNWNWFHWETGITDRNRYLPGRTERIGALVGTGQLLVVDSRSSANSGLIILKTVQMLVPSKMDMAFTICAWRRHFHHVCLMSVCLSSWTNIPFNYCLSWCYMSHFLLSPLILFPSFSSSSTASCFFAHDSSAWIAPWCDYICTCVLLENVCLETRSKGFGEISRHSSLGHFAVVSRHRSSIFSRYLGTQAGQFSHLFNTCINNSKVARMKGSVRFLYLGPTSSLLQYYCFVLLLFSHLFPHFLTFSLSLASPHSSNGVLRGLLLFWQISCCSATRPVKWWL